MRRILVLLLMAVIFSPATVLSQTRTRRSAPATPRKPAATAATEVQRAGATRVAEQIKTLTRFIYLLGGVAKGLESVDEAAKRNEASPAILEQTAKNKATVRTSIQTIREALDKLEIDFRATPNLQRYYIKLAGTASGAATAEELAAANQFDRAGRTLLGVVNQLTDVLLEMR